MTTQVTETDQLAELQIHSQRAAFDALANLVRMFPTAPAPYVIVHEAGPCWESYISLVCDSPQAFEQWRVALQLAPADVSLLASKTSAHLAADAVFAGVRIHVTGHGVPLDLEPRELEETVEFKAVVPLAEMPAAAAEAVNV